MDSTSVSGTEGSGSIPGGRMRFQILFFSVLQEIVGSHEIERELEAADLGDVLDALFDEFPDLKKWEGRLLYAVDQEFADRDTKLRNQAEIAIMPPVQGG